MDIDTHNRRPLEKKLIAIFSFIGFKIIAQVTVLKPQAVKLADLPGEEWRIAKRPLAWVINHRSIIE